MPVKTDNLCNLLQIDISWEQIFNECNLVLPQTISKAVATLRPIDDRYSNLENVRTEAMRTLLIGDAGKLTNEIKSRLADGGHEVVLAENLMALRCAGPIADFELLMLDLNASQIDAISFIESQSRFSQQRKTVLLGIRPELNDKLSKLGFNLEQCVADPWDKGQFLAAIETFEKNFRKVKDFADKEAAVLQSMRPIRARAGPAGPELGKVIVVASHKGGTGKTTVAMHLIAGLSQNGHKVAAVDLDRPQLSLSRYIDNRRAYAEAHSLNLPLPLHQMPRDPERDLAAFQNGLREYKRRMDYVVVDCPAGRNEASQIAINVADCVVTPLNDSFVDLDLLAVLEPVTLAFRRLGAFGEAIVEARRSRTLQGLGDLDWIVLRNRLTNIDSHNKARMADAMVDLAARLDMRPGPGLSERVIYRELFLEGLTLLDLRREGVAQRLSLSHVAARQELRALLDLILFPKSAEARKSIPQAV